jgi:hypothetical protein
MHQTASLSELMRLVTWILVRRSVRPDNAGAGGRNDRTFDLDVTSERQA